MKTTMVFNLMTGHEHYYLLAPKEALISQAIIADKRSLDVSNVQIRELYKEKIKVSLSGKSAWIKDLSVIL